MWSVAKRELVAAAGGRAVHDAEKALAGILAGILDGVAGLVGELAEVDLVRVARAGQHADVGAGAEHAILARAQQHGFHLGMLETQPLHGVGEFDVDAEIVGIQLELVALEQAAVLVDVHRQRGDVAVDRKLPVPVARRIGLEIDEGRAVGERAGFPGHDVPSVSWYMHNNAGNLGSRVAIMHFRAGQGGVSSTGNVLRSAFARSAASASRSGS